MWGGGIMLVIFLLFVSGVLMFGPAAEDRDHRPPDARAATHGSR